MMVNNSTNINKTNNVFHLKPLNTKKIPTYGVGNLCPGLEQVQKYGGVKPVNWIPSASRVYAINYVGCQ